MLYETFKEKGRYIWDVRYSLSVIEPMHAGSMTSSFIHTPIFYRCIQSYRQIPTCPTIFFLSARESPYAVSGVPDKPFSTCPKDLAGVYSRPCLSVWRRSWKPILATRRSLTTWRSIRSTRSTRERDRKDAWWSVEFTEAYDIEREIYDRPPFKYYRIFFEVAYFRGRNIVDWLKRDIGFVILTRTKERFLRSTSGTSTAIYPQPSRLNSRNWMVYTRCDQYEWMAAWQTRTVCDLRYTWLIRTNEGKSASGCG